MSTRSSLSDMQAMISNIVRSEPSFRLDCLGSLMRMASDSKTLLAWIATWMTPRPLFTV